MDIHQAQQKKRILSDPVAVFTREQHDATGQQIAALQQYWHDYVESKHQQKIIKNECKMLSREIGQAKRNGQSVAALVQTMQTRTAELKSVENRLGAVSERILAFFESGNDPAQAAGESVLSANRHDQLGDAIAIEEISVKRLDDDQAAWNRYVEANESASIYHRAEWQTLIRQQFGHESHYLYAHSGKLGIVGILPLVRLKSRLFGDFMVSMPYFNYGGAIAESLSIENKLIQTANGIAENLGISHIEYRDDIARQGLPTKTGKVNMILALPENKDQLWHGFTSKLRSQIRRPQRETVRIRCGGVEYLNDFYRVFARNMRDLGTPVYGKSFFREILQCFAKQSKLMVLYLHDRPVAAGFLLGHKNTLEIPWASTIRDVNHLSMNMLLYWEVLKFAVENGYRNFDFGRSSTESGTFRFKQQWGARPKQLFWHYWLAKNTELPQLNPDNAKYAVAINIWKRLPIGITKLLGPHIVKNLP